MWFKLTLLLTCLFYATQKTHGITEHLDNAIKYVESIYNQLELKVNESIENLKKKIAGGIFTVVEVLDSRISQAKAKIEGITEDCRIPAQLSLENLEKKVKEEFYECSSNSTQDHIDSLQNDREELIATLRNASSMSLQSIEECFQSETEALTELRFEFLGSCKFTTGFKISEQFIDSASSVQKFTIKILRFSYDATSIITNCFKEEVIDSTVHAIITAADQCHRRIKSNI